MPVIETLLNSLQNPVGAAGGFIAGLPNPDEAIASHLPGPLQDPYRQASAGFRGLVGAIPSTAAQVAGGAIPAISLPRRKAPIVIDQSELPEGTLGRFIPAGPGHPDYSRILFDPEKINLAKTEGRSPLGTLRHEWGHAAADQAIPTLYRGFTRGGLRKPSPDSGSRVLAHEMLASMRAALGENSIEPIRHTITAKGLRYPNLRGTMSQLWAHDLIPRELTMISHVARHAAEHPTQFLNALMKLSGPHMPSKIQQAVKNLWWVRRMAEREASGQWPPKGTP